MKAEYDKIAEKFMKEDVGMSLDVSRKLLYPLFNFKQLKGKKILDLGCGYGKDLQYFHNKKLQAQGIDISKEMIKLAKKNCPDCELKVGDFKKLPYKNNYFHFIYSRYAIQHSNEVQTILKEVHRILRKKGEFIFLVTHPFRQYFEKKTKDYWYKEKISCKIIGEKVIVKETPYTISEYLNSFVIKNFKLENFIEAFDSEAQKVKGKGKYPSVLIIHLKKL